MVFKEGLLSLCHWIRTTKYNKGRVQVRSSGGVSFGAVNILILIL